MYRLISSIHRISIAMQSDFHDPVKVVKRIWDFKWTMAKLVLVLNKALDKEDTNLTHFSKFIKGVMKNENKKLENQGVQLKQYKGSLQNVKDHYLITVLSICKIVETSFIPNIYKYRVIT